MYEHLLKHPPSRRPRRGAVILRYRDNKQACGSTVAWSVRRMSLDPSHRVCVRGVAVSFDRGVRTCRHAVGTLFSRNITQAVNTSRHGAAVGDGA